MNEGAFFSKDQFLEVIRAWREEWDVSPHQFLLSEQFRQSDPQSYAAAVGEYLWSKLREAAQGGPRP